MSTCACAVCTNLTYEWAGTFYYPGLLCLHRGVEVVNVALASGTERARATTKHSPACCQGLLITAPPLLASFEESKPSFGIWVQFASSEQGCPRQLSRDSGMQKPKPCCPISVLKKCLVTDSYSLSKLISREHGRTVNLNSRFWAATLESRPWWLPMRRYQEWYLESAFLLNRTPACGEDYLARPSEQTRYSIDNDSSRATHRLIGYFWYRVCSCYGGVLLYDIYVFLAGPTISKLSGVDGPSAFVITTCALYMDPPELIRAASG